MEDRFFHKKNFSDVLFSNFLPRSVTNCNCNSETLILLEHKLQFAVISPISYFYPFHATGLFLYPLKTGIFDVLMFWRVIGRDKWHDSGYNMSKGDHRNYLWFSPRVFNHQQQFDLEKQFCLF